MFDGTAVPLTFVQVCQTFIQDFPALNLHLEIQRCVNLETPAIQKILSIFFQKITPYMLSEVGGPFKGVDPFRVNIKLGIQCLVP